jgi:hypothetical protein
MKKIAVPLIILLFFQISTAQNTTRREVVTLLPQQLNQATLWMEDGKLTRKASAMASVPLQKNGPFLAWSIVWEADGWDEKSDHLVVAFQGESGQTVISHIQPDPHAEQVRGRYISTLQFLENECPKFRVHYTGLAKISRIDLHFFDPGLAPGDLPSSSSQTPLSAVGCSQPDYQNRKDWCPDESCPPNPSPSVTIVTHLIVHHAAGTNVSSNWAAVVRSIWDFHVNVNGWSDIGYNWLVAPNGVLYEGRGNNILGAHFCGKNSGTMGVCMLGNYTSIEPSDKALHTLEELLAWNCTEKNLDPLGAGFHASSGLTLHRISGHRDGCATACPGDAFYPLLPDVRNEVKSYIENGCMFPVGVSSAIDEKAIRIFPNPASDMVTLTMDNQWTGNLTLSFYDALGRDVGPSLSLYKSQFREQFDVSIEALPPGVYWIKVGQEKNTVLLKLVRKSN